jgi:hypothetical protein
MKPLVAFIMRGPGQAAFIVSLTGLLSLLVPFVGLLSSGALALVTLRSGTRDGLRIAALAGVGCLLGSLLLLGTGRPVLVVVFVLWAPVWVLAVLLRFSRSLAFTAQAAALAGVSGLLLAHTLVPDLSGTWQGILAPLQAALVQDGLMDKAAAEAALTDLAPWVTGSFAAALMLEVLLGLWLGRWWQALLYNPGGFGADFRAFRLHPVLGAAGFLLLGLAVIAPGPGLVSDLLLVLSPLWLFQGLAVIHDLLALRRIHRGWLVGLYLLLVLLMPQSLTVVAGLGLVDVLIDLRARVRKLPLG